MKQQYKRVLAFLAALCLAVSAGCHQMELGASAASAEGVGGAPFSPPGTTEPGPLRPPVSRPEPVPESGPEPPAEENHTLYILMYHHVVPEDWSCNTWTVTDAKFRSDLEWLAEHGYVTVLPSQLAAGEPLPERAVLLTLDDGYASNYWMVFPLLQEFQAKAVISVITSYVEKEKSGYLTWNMCKVMSWSGLVEIGSHTYACHEGENGILRRKHETREEYEARVIPDLQTSIDLIAANLEAPPQFFAYPNGKVEPWAKSFIREHFAATVTTRHGSADISQGLYAMNRFTVSMDVDLDDILPG